MYEPDFNGDMSYYQDQLSRKGISKEMLDMDNFIGLTASELQSIVDSVVVRNKKAEEELRCLSVK